MTIQNLIIAIVPFLSFIGFILLAAGMPNKNWLLTKAGKIRHERKKLVFFYGTPFSKN